MKTVEMRMRKGTKRVLGAMLAGAVLLAINGCGKSSESNGEVQSTVPSQAEQRQEQVEPTQKQDEPTQKQDEPIQKQADDDEKKQAAVNHLLTVWTDYLQTLDKLYGSELWALDYTDAFLESSDWGDLSRARTACIASARYLSELAMTEKDLTEEEYLTLAQAGIDSAYQSEEFQSVPTFAEDARQEVRDHLLAALENDIFMESGMDILRDKVAVYRDSITYMCQYYCAATNYMLLTLNDEETAADYWKAMSSYPVLSGAGFEWMDDETSLKKTTDKILDAYEEIQGRQADILSKSSADLYNLEQIIEHADIDGLAASAHSLSGAPVLLPAPDWYCPEDAKYLSYVQKEGKDIAYPESGDELTEDAYSVYMQVEQVSIGEIKEYINLASGIADDTWEGDDNNWYIVMPDYYIGLTLKDDCVTIIFVGQDITFAPAWYLAVQGK